MRNPVLDLVVARIRVLLEETRSDGTLPHAATIGALREQRLRNFLRSLIPSPLAITSGFICDPVGTLTPQLDLIVFDPTRILPIAMSSEVSVVPSDSALAVVEIKSTLTTAVRDQICAQHAAINRLSHSGVTIELGAEVKIPQVVVAFDSTVALETMDSWFDACTNLVLVSVLQAVTIAKTTEGARAIIRRDSSDDYVNVRAFMVYFFAVLNQVVQLRGGVSPRLGNYVMPEWRREAG